MNIFDFLFRRKKYEQARTNAWYDEKMSEMLTNFPFLKDNPFEYRIMDESELKRRAQIINESGELVENSKNIQTRISRCELCIKMLFEVCACFPLNRQYASALGEALRTMGKLQTGYRFDPKCLIQEPTNDYGFQYQNVNGCISMKPATVDGIPVYEYAETHKHDFQKMYECCIAELDRAKKTKDIPAPYYFGRCAILAKKAKRYDIEVKVCQSYLAFVDRFIAEGHPGPRIDQSPRVLDMRKRLPKAMANLKKDGKP